MVATGNLEMYLSAFLPLIPLCLLWLAGCFLSLATWKRHPSVSLVALIAFLLLLCNLVIGQVVWVVFIQSQRNLGWSMAQMSLALSVLAWVRTVVSSVGYGLLLLAVFGWRNRAVIRREDLDVSLPRGPRDSDAIRPAD